MKMTMKPDDNISSQNIFDPVLRILNQEQAFQVPINLINQKQNLEINIVKIYNVLGRDVIFVQEWTPIWRNIIVFTQVNDHLFANGLAVVKHFHEILPSKRKYFGRVIFNSEL